MPLAVISVVRGKNRSAREKRDIPTPTNMEQVFNCLYTVPGAANDDDDHDVQCFILFACFA